MKTRVIILLLFLLLSGSVASATTQYPLASVDIEDEIKVKSVTNTRFMAANDNVISLLEVEVLRPVGITTVNITTPDHVVVYTITNTKTGIVERTLVRNIKSYRNGVLVDNMSSTWSGPEFLLDNRDTIYLKEGSAFIKKGSVSAGNLTAESAIIPTHEVTVSTATSSVIVTLRVSNVAELQRIAIEDDLNPLFSFMYWALSIAYDDADGGLLSFLYIFSFSMDAILWLIWISITSTFSVFAWIESFIVFYAGWRNNKIKGFVDNLVKWHIAIGKAIAGAIYALFIIVYDFIKSVVPGIG